MYRVPAEPDKFRFGDLLEAEWLYDLYLREDGDALEPTEVRGSEAYMARRSRRSQDQQGGRDFVLSHADYSLGFGNRRRAVFLSDDCEAESLLERRGGRGRLLLAAVSPWPSNENEQRDALGTRSFRRFPLPPETEVEFPGAVVELQRVFSVAVSALPHTTRVLELTDEMRTDLRRRWCAHATRHGPLVAQDGAYELASLLTANGDAALAEQLRHGTVQPGQEHMDRVSPLAGALSDAWAIEGVVMDRVADDLEAGAAPERAVDDLIAALEMVQDGTAGALAALRSLRHDEG